MYRVFKATETMYVLQISPKIHFYPVKFVIFLTDRDASAKNDFSCVILSKSEVNQLVVFVQAFMQR